MNKKYLDPKTRRIPGVSCEDAVVCTIKGKNGRPIEFDTIEVPFHKKNIGLGTKQIFKMPQVVLSQEDADIFCESEEFTLLNIGNAIVKKKNVFDGKVISMEVEENFEGDFKTTKNKISWVSCKASMVIKTARRRMRPGRSSRWII